MNRSFLPELARTLALFVVLAVLQPLLARWIGPFSDHPERVVAVLLPLGIVIAALGWPVHRDGRVLLGGGFLAFFLGFCLLFSIAAASDLFSGRRTPLVGYEQAVPGSFFGINRLGDWRYALLPTMPGSGRDTVVLTLDPKLETRERRRNFAALIRQAILRRAEGIAFDFYFEEPSDDVDRLLCATVRQADSAQLPVYFGYRHVEENGLIRREPLPPTLGCLEGRLASLAGYREADGVVRMLPLYLQNRPENESLSLKAARVLAGGPIQLPTSGLVQFTRPRQDHQPLVGLPSPGQLQAFEDRFVFVGSARAGDVRATPFGDLPGVKIHELAARSLSEGRFIERLGPGWSFPLIFALCLVLSVAQARGTRPRHMAAIAVALVAAVIVLAALAIRLALVWVDVSYVVLAVGSMTGLLLAGSVVQRQRHHREAIVLAAVGSDVLLATGHTAQPERRIFDVFLSHNADDKATVRELAEALKGRGLEVWLDEWELVPGRPWQEAVEEAIQTARTAAVLVGPDGLGPWEVPEMRACLEMSIRRRMPVIPVLLPGATTSPTLPLFLGGYTWVDLRGGLDEAGLDRLVWGITGVKPRRSATAPRRQRA